MESYICSNGNDLPSYLEAQDAPSEGCPINEGWVHYNSAEVQFSRDTEPPPPYWRLESDEGFSNLINVLDEYDNPRRLSSSFSHSESDAESGCVDIYNSADEAPSGQTSQSTGHSEQQPQNTKKECGSKTWTRTNISIIIICFASITICGFILSGMLENFRPVPDYANAAKIRVPCDDLSMFMPEAALYKSTQNLTKQKLEDVGIRRVAGQGKDGVSCEVALDLLMGRIIRKEYDAVEGQVTLKIEDTGPELQYSKYTMSIKNTGQLSRVNIHPNGLLIEEEGPYFIYFGMQLDYKDGCCRHLRYQTSISHLLVEEVSRTPKALLASEYTCTGTTDSEKTTTFTGGIFHLNPDDKLFIRVSSTEIVGESGDNFLGVFKLPSL